MFGGDQGFGDAPDVFFRSHPVLAIQARQVHGARVGAQGAFAAQVVVLLEVAERQFAQGAVDRRAETQPGKV